MLIFPIAGIGGTWITESDLVKKTQLLLVLGTSCAGLVCGLVAHRASRGAPGPRLAPSAAESLNSPVANTPQAAPAAAPQASLKPISSTDTVETLLALNDATLYPRLAAWLLGVGESELAAYWDGCKASRKTGIAELVLIRWTRLNPEGAIAAAAGMKDESTAWWAWAAHDPQAALDAAIATAPKMVKRVAQGIGRFHPEWLRENLERIPESSRAAALAEFKNAGDREAPLETLKFMQENAQGFNPGAFKALVEEDPWKALEWLEGNPFLLGGGYRGTESPLDVLLETMKLDHPDDLQRLAARMPAGFMKRELEDALFDNLLAADPAAAVAQAKATESVVVAAERFAKIGLSVINDDPDLAFEMAGRLLGIKPSGHINPTGIAASVVVAHPGGFSFWGGGDDGVAPLLNELVKRDPERLMRTCLEVGTADKYRLGFNLISSGWASQDVGSYAKWVDQQTDPAIRERALEPLVYGLKRLGQYFEAMDWTEGYQQDSLFQDWTRADPEDAAGWLESAKLSEDRKLELREILEKETSRKAR